MVTPAKREATYRDVLEAPPHLVAEILSPSTRATDRVRKLPIYAEHGVEYAWLVDPLDRSLEVFRNTDGRWTLLGACCDDAEVQPEPFDAVPLPLGELWVAPRG